MVVDASEDWPWQPVELSFFDRDYSADDLGTKSAVPLSRPETTSIR